MPRAAKGENGIWAKACFRCGKSSSGTSLDSLSTAFFRVHSMPDGLSGLCKACDNEKRKKARFLLSQVASENRLEKERIRSLTRFAISCGKLKRLACQVCGDPKTDAHHHDYSKPYDVTFLCRKHHAEEHSRLREDAGAINHIPEGPLFDAHREEAARQRKKLSNRIRKPIGPICKHCNRQSSKHRATDMACPIGHGLHLSFHTEQVFQSPKKRVFKSKREAA